MNQNSNQSVNISEKNYWVNSWKNPVLLLSLLISNEIKIPKKTIAISGIATAFIFFEDHMFLNNFWLTLALIFILGPIIQMLFFLVLSKYFLFTGKFMTGTATTSSFANTFLVLCTSLSSTIPLFVLKVILLGDAVFNHSKLFLMNSIFSLVNSFYSILWVILFSLLFINFIKMLAFIQNWSIFKSVLNALISFFILTLPYIIFNLIFIK